jgi:predicted DNA-binding transcriptional regulator AlpA
MRDRLSISSAITPRLLSVNDAASYISSTPWFVEELIRTGKIHTTSIANSRLIDIHDLDAWVDSQTGATNPRKVSASGATLRQDALEILTPEEVAKRLKVKVSWVYEKRRPRTKNPIPCLPLGRYIRFDWNAVLRWLDTIAVEELQPSKRERS